MESSILALLLRFSVILSFHHCTNSFRNFRSWRSIDSHDLTYKLTGADLYFPCERFSKQMISISVSAKKKRSNASKQIEDLVILSSTDQDYVKISDDVQRMDLKEVTLLKSLRLPLNFESVKMDYIENKTEIETFLSSPQILEEAKKVNSSLNYSKEPSIPSIPLKVQIKVEKIINDTASEVQISLKSISWINDRIEIVICNNADGSSPHADILMELHSLIFRALDSRNKELNIVENFEIIVASPGVGDILLNDRDFVSFQGFNVDVTTKEAINNKTSFKGSLIGRVDGQVVISMKGRIMRVSMDNVAEVRLPKAKYETFDEEIKKLQQ